jgi:Trk K+ transport system NAD-binding subunit
MARATLKQRLRYRFDNTFARGVWAMIGWLAVVTFVLAFIFSAIIVGASLFPSKDGARPSDAHQIYQTVIAVLNFKTFDSGSWWFTAVMFLVGLSALFIVSALVGLLVSAFRGKLEELRRGRSFVVEEGHSLILGWSEAVFTILKELSIANESRNGAAVVILADMDKVKMDEKIAKKVKGGTGKTRVVTRNGSPMDPGDLEIVNPGAARSIIVLSGSAEDPDVETIKTLLALTHGRDGDGPMHVVAEIEHERNLEVARIAGGEHVTVVPKGQTIARLMVQASRQSGISVAYTELFDFGGDEIYFRSDASLVGKTYGDALLAYEDCAVVGLRNGDGARLNPAPETPIHDSDSIVAIAADDSVLDVAAPFAGGVEDAALASADGQVHPPTRVLMLGWNARATVLLDELDAYSAPGSSVRIIADADDVDDAVAARESMTNLRISYEAGDITARKLLDSLDVPSFDAVMVLAEADAEDEQQADARTLVTLLHLRDVAAKAGKRVPIVSEMLDDRNRELAQITKVDDVIVSERVISLMLAQISENRELAPVFADLLDADGSEIHLKPVDRYVTGPASFATIVASARRLGETAIGYRTFANREVAKQQFGVRINPPKSATFDAAAGDRVIVLAED